MVRVALAIAALIVVIAIFCAIDALMIDRSRIRALPRWVWVLLIVLLPALGSVLWMLVGRGKLAKSVAPDDDPEFLAQLKKRLSDDQGTNGKDTGV